MARIEQLLTSMEAHGNDPRRMLLPAAGTGPASERIDGQDVMRALVSLPKGQRAALCLKANPNLVSAQELAAFCYDRQQILARHDGKTGTFKGETPEQAFARQARVVRVAIDEYRDPRSCRRCNGHGKHLAHVEGKGVVEVACEKCVGRGFVLWSDNRRARGVGVKRENWLTRHAPGYDLVLNSCTAEYRAAATAFKQALFGEEAQVA